MSDAFDLLRIAAALGAILLPLAIAWACLSWSDRRRPSARKQHATDR